jgi:hypothetical protein
MREWVVVGEAGMTACLAPLIEARRRSGPVRIIEAERSPPIAPSWWRDGLGEPAGVLLIHPPELSPRSAVPGPVVRTNGRLIPIGVLPALPAELRRYADTALAVLAREPLGATKTAILLGDRSGRTARAADRLAAVHDHSSRLRVFRWTADRIRRDQLMHALGGGFGTAVYIGHGVPSGWIGYGGIGLEGVAGFHGEPVAAVLALTCESAARRPGRLSLAESIVFAGLAASVLAAPGKTGHESNVVLAGDVLEGLAGAHLTTIGQLVASQVRVGRHLARFRIIGDPLTQLASTSHAEAWGGEIAAPAPDDPLPPLGPDEWPTASRAAAG